MRVFVVALMLVFASLILPAEGYCGQKEFYQTIPLTAQEQAKIRDILTTLRDNNEVMLLFEKPRLMQLKKEIYHVHSFAFLVYVFKDRELTDCMRQIRKSYFKWNGFTKGISEKLNRLLKAGVIYQYIPLFAETMRLPPQKIRKYIDQRNFEGLVLYLMNHA